MTDPIAVVRLTPRGHVRLLRRRFRSRIRCRVGIPFVGCRINWLLFGFILVMVRIVRPVARKMQYRFVCIAQLLEPLWIILGPGKLELARVGALDLAFVGGGPDAENAPRVHSRKPPSSCRITCCSVSRARRDSIGFWRSSTDWNTATCCAR